MSNNKKSERVVCCKEMDSAECFIAPPVASYRASPMLVYSSQTNSEGKKLRDDTLHFREHVASSSRLEMWLE